MPWFDAWKPPELARMRESISNPVAWEIAETAYAACNLGGDRWVNPRIVFRQNTDGWNLVEDGFPWTTNARKAARRTYLRDKLKTSGLVAKLLDGADSLPDIYPILPPLARIIEQFARPRRARDLTRRVLRYLDWYLEPTGKVSLAPLYWRFARSLGISTALVLPFCLLSVWAGEPFPNVTLQSAYGPLWLSMLPVLIAFDLRTFGVGGLDEIAAQEFFNYLWQTFTTANLSMD